MPKPKPKGKTQRASLDVARELALLLPGAEEATSWGSLAFKVHGQWFAIVPTHKSAEPNSLAVRVDFDTRAELLESAPDVYYVKEHYLSYPTVLIRLPKIGRDALESVLRMAWQKTKKSGRTHKR